MRFAVYIIKGHDNSLYTGMTSHLQKRLQAHRLGKVPFTKNKGPLEVVYVEKFESRKDAAQREKEIKGWRREKKEMLIESH